MRKLSIQCIFLSHMYTQAHAYVYFSLTLSDTYFLSLSLSHTPRSRTQISTCILEKVFKHSLSSFSMYSAHYSLSLSHTHTHVLTKHTSEWSLSLSLVTIFSLPSIAETVAQSQRSNTIFLSRQSFFARLKNGIAFARFFRKLSSKVLLVIRKTSYELRSYYDQIQLKYQLKLIQKFLGLTIRHITVKMAVISIGFTRVATQQHLKHFIILFLRKGKTLLK